MRTAIFALAILASGAASAQSVSNEASTNTHSDAGAVAHTGAITFEGSQPLRHQSVSTTPPAYIAPSMFAPGTCGMSDTAAVSVTGFGIGGSKSKESEYCNARQDTATAFNLGYQEVAAMRFFCFGSDENRQAFEAVGNRCPEGATAKGLQRQQAVAGYQGNDPIVIGRLQGR